MFSRAWSRPRGKSEGEKPFWISYADLMTALMVMFLVTMAVTILALGKRIEARETPENTAATGKQKVCAQIKTGITALKSVKVDCDQGRIDFGVGGEFPFDSYKPNPEATEILKSLVPVILSAASSGNGEKWLKQVVIEGHTDTTGGYLSNLNLSLARSYWIMCMLVDPRINSAMGFDSQQVAAIRDLFLAGGVSFNDAKQSSNASRRVELRLQFYSLAEREAGASRASRAGIEIGQCALN